MRRLSFPFLSLLILATAPAASAAQAVVEPLRLRPGDAVRIEVGDEPELAGDFVISSDGDALLPLIGMVIVAGRPFPEVRAEVLAAYGRKLTDRQVLVIPVLRIAVLGEVRQPGLLPVDPTYTVADVIAAAGGVTPLGDPSRITLSRESGVIRFSLTGDDAVLSEALRPGDQIVVARQSWVRENLGVLLGAGASVLAAAVTTLLLER